MIYTFYSYKGGVGRSMALVNIAELMYQAGLKVLMIDWDLDAPGLERFFPESVDRVFAHKGLIDMLVDYKKIRQIPHDKPLTPPFYKIEEYIVNNLRPKSINGGELWLLSAGYRKNLSHYTHTVTTFNWQEFYDIWEGEPYFEWFRHELENLADVILIDSRTGVTDIGGICTYQLADVVIALTIPNNQSMQGIAHVIANLNEKKFQIIRNEIERPLKTLVIPARVERWAEQKILNAFRVEFATKFSDYLPTELNLKADNLEIPYIPYYSFGEKIASDSQIRNSDERNPDLERAYMTLLNILEDATPEKETTIKTVLHNFLSANSEKVVSKHDPIQQMHERIKEAEDNLILIQQKLDDVKTEALQEQVEHDRLRYQKAEADLKAVQNAYSQQLYEINSRLLKSYQAYYDTQSRLSSRLTDIEGMTRRIESQVKDNKKIKEHAQQLDNQLIANEKTIKNLSTQLDSIKAELGRTQQLYSAQETLLNNLSAQLESSKIEIQKATDLALVVGQAEENLTISKQELIQTQSELNQTRLMIERKEQELNQAHQNLNQQTTQVNTLLAQLISVQAELTQIQEVRDLALTRQLQTEKELKNHKQELVNLQSKLDQTIQKLNKLDRKWFFSLVLGVFALSLGTLVTQSLSIYPAWLVGGILVICLILFASSAAYVLFTSYQVSRD